MKISGYHKMKGDTVGFNISDPDKIYASVIFTRNAHKVDGLSILYPKAKIDIGGPGVNLKKKLPVEIEYLSPTDYSLYPDCDSYYGFTSRGCIRNCPFCIVPQKEGKWSQVRGIDSIINDRTDDRIIHRQNNIGTPPERYDKLTLLDNNILAWKEWFMEQTAQIPPHMKVDFNQGLDIRLVDREIADRLKTLHPINCWIFAFDSLRYKGELERGINILTEAGINPRSIMFYVYLDGDHDFDDAFERCNILKKLGTNAFLMINRESKRTARMTALKRWFRPWAFWSTDFDTFKCKVRPTSPPPLCAPIVRWSD
jgi:hypothetical protein